MRTRFFSICLALGLFGVMLGMTGCAHPLDHAPLNQLSTQEQTQAADELKKTMLSVLEEKYFQSFCKVLFVAFATQGGQVDPSNYPNASSVCDSQVQQCKQQATNAAEEQRKLMTKQTLDLSKCPARFSELQRCYQKHLDLIYQQADKISCGAPTAWKDLGAFDPNKVEGCQQLMEDCPFAGGIVGTSGKGGSNPTPDIEPQPSP